MEHNRRAQLQQFREMLDGKIGMRQPQSFDFRMVPETNFGFRERDNFPKPAPMPGAIEYPDFFYTPEGKFIDPMGSSRIMGGTPGRAEEGFGRGKGREGASIATLDLSTLSVEDLIDRYGISREQAEKIVEFNKNEMLKRVDKDDLLKRFEDRTKTDKGEKNLLDAILPFISPGVGTSGIMKLLSGEKTGRDRLQDGGRIGFESGTREGRTVGMSKNRVTQLLDLRQEAVDKKDEDKIIEIDQELSMMGFRTSKALGGRIGFQKGRSVQPLQIPQLGTGDMIQYFRDALKQANPNATDEELDDAAEKMFRGELAVKDSKRGLGSMVASADDEDDYKSPPFIDDPEGRMETDPFEMIREALEKGRISELPDSDIYSMYDAAVERGAFDGTFEEFKDMLSQLQQRQRRPEGIMQTMVT